MARELLKTLKIDDVCIEVYTDSNFCIVHEKTTNNYRVWGLRDASDDIAKKETKRGFLFKETGYWCYGSVLHGTQASADVLARLKSILVKTRQIIFDSITVTSAPLYIHDKRNWVRNYAKAILEGK